MTAALAAVVAALAAVTCLLAHVLHQAAQERAGLHRELRHAHNLLATRHGGEAAVVERAQAAADTTPTTAPAAPADTTAPGPYLSD